MGIVHYQTATTGLSNNVATANSSAFDITPAGTGAGINITSGTLANWSIQSVLVEAFNF
jgi:hypothetical protein